MQDEDALPITPESASYTATFQPDPPDMPVSDEGAKTLRKLADQFAQLEGNQELGRDERFYQIVVHFRRNK